MLGTLHCVGRARTPVSRIARHRLRALLSPCDVHLPVTRPGGIGVVRDEWRSPLGARGRHD